MIKLKDKINKSVALRTIRRDAEKMYKESWQPELQIEAYVKGAEAILNYLHIPRVVNWLPFEYENHDKYQQYHKEGKLIVKFEDGTECNFKDELPQKIITHFRKG